jgi:hypothetical protein
MVVERSSDNGVGGIERISTHKRVVFFSFRQGNPLELEKSAQHMEKETLRAKNCAKAARQRSNPQNDSEKCQL